MFSKKLGRFWRNLEDSIDNDVNVILILYAQFVCMYVCVCQIQVL